MYDEVMQLIALAKNDEQYFKRIEELKQKQLEVAHVLEIAETLKEADMHLAKARQQATGILEAAKDDATQIKASADSFIAENKEVLEKNKEIQKALKEKQAELVKKDAELTVLEKEKFEVIKEHRKLTADRTLEQQAAQKVRLEFEGKLKKLRELATS